MRRVVWREGARRDARVILAYIAERNAAAAKTLRDRFDAVIAPLPVHPFLHRPGRVAGTREIVAHPNYIVVYRVTDRTIEIVAIVHARQQYP